LFLFIHCSPALLQPAFLQPSPTYTELGKLQKMVIPRETGDMSLEMGVAISCRKSSSQVGGGEFLLMRMRGTRITWRGGKKNNQILLLSVAPLLSRRGGFQEVSPM